MMINPFSSPAQNLITVTEPEHAGPRAVLATVAWPKSVRGSAPMLHAAALSLDGLRAKTRELGKSFNQEMVVLLVARQASATAPVGTPVVKHTMIFQ